MQRFRAGFSSAALQVASVATVISVCTLVARPALADEPPDKAVCARSYERAQRLRKAEELRAAHAELLVCARAECPALLRRDCVTWLGQVAALMPTVIIVARHSNGRAEPAARVIIDGAPVSERTLQEPLALDPGEHVVRIEAPGVAPVEQRVTLHEGERDRRVEATFSAPLREPDPPARVEPVASPIPSPESSPERVEPERPVPPFVYILGGVGIAATLFGGYFQISGMSKRSDLDLCAPRCSTSDVDDARRSLWIGNVVLTASVAALVGATILYFTRPEAATRGAAAR